MRKRLSVTIFGTLYYVGALHLTPDIMRVGRGAYGKDEWDEILSDVALGHGQKNLAQQVSHTIGQPLERVYTCHGVAMDGHRFGMEVFHRGESIDVTMVEALNTVVHPAKYMQGYGPHDALGVYWATQEGGAVFQWDNVEQVNQENIELVYDTLSPLMALKENFSLAQNVVWNGKVGRRKGIDFGTGLHAGKHVFHRGK